MTAEKSKKIKTIRGTVVSSSMDKTVVVEISRVKTHPLYHKKFAMHNKIKAHDENNEYKKGDEVEISSTRPISKDKYFKVVGKVK